MHQQQTAFENIEGKEEIDRKCAISSFPTMFSTHQKIVPPFVNDSLPHNPDF